MIYPALVLRGRNDRAPDLLRMGDRLAFSNGIILLAVASTLILVSFHGQTESLIPLFAVGVFLAFTLSQAGMVVHWWRLRSPHWRKSMVINGIGASASGLVLVTAALTKFVAGAWVAVVAGARADAPASTDQGALRVRRATDERGSMLGRPISSSPRPRFARRVPQAPFA